MASNTFSDRFPRVGIVPWVTFCIQPSKLIESGYETVITARTDTEITFPFWAFFFDAPVVDAKVDMRDPNHEPLASSAGHPLQLGLQTEPLSTLPVASRLFISADQSLGISTDNIIRVQVACIGQPFSGMCRPWGPKDDLKINVQSKAPIKPIAIASGYGTEFLPEHMAIECAKQQ